jgi:O-succinylbenzoate synthase
VVSSALDSSVGMAAGVALAAALPQLPYACGLGTVELLATDVAHDRLVPVGGSVPVGPARADDDLVAAAAAAPDRVDWWRERVSTCHAYLLDRAAPRS